MSCRAVTEAGTRLIGKPRIVMCKHHLRSGAVWKYFAAAAGAAVFEVMALAEVGALNVIIIAGFHSLSRDIRVSIKAWAPDARATGAALLM